MFGQSKVSPLPTNIPAAQLPHSSCEFFTEKIKQIRQNLDNAPSPHVQTVVPNIATPLVQFSAVSEKEAHNINKKSAQKTCELDPLPTSLLYENTYLLFPALTNIINRSLLSGEVPFDFKTAVVKPLLKKAGLDPNQMKNYRPVSNLLFLTKILEKEKKKWCSSQLIRLPTISHKFQSAYRAGHSTETILLRIVNDILTASDAKQVYFLTLLDLSATFDTIDYSLLLCR